MALRVLATEAVSSLGLRRAVPVLSNAQPQFLQVFSQNFASGTHFLVADLYCCCRSMRTSAMFKYWCKFSRSCEGSGLSR